MLDQELAKAIAKIRDQDLYISCEPEILDPTNPERSSKLILHSPGLRVGVPLSTNSKSLSETMGALLVLFEDLKDQGKIIAGWNIKSLYTYAKAILGRSFEFDGTIFDLKAIERFVGIRDGSAPKTLREAKARLTQVIKSPSWDKTRLWYKEVAWPLISDVLSSVESTRLADSEAKKHVSSYYEVEGQVNGRLASQKILKYSYNPHSMSPEEKAVLRPSDYDKQFLYFDYRHMEVSTLQWLSKDPVLEDAINSGEDLYSFIWRRLTTLEPNEKFRDQCKLIFLPVIYGCGSETIARKHGISQNTAEKLVDRIYKTFKVSLDWISSQQFERDENNFVTDVFGRRRKMESDLYKVRNFAVQAPASLICIHKLIVLHRVLKSLNAEVAMHIHDGYVVMADRGQTPLVVEKACEALEKEEALYPGLKLSVACRVGGRLDMLKPFDRKKEKNHDKHTEIISDNGE